MLKPQGFGSWSGHPAAEALCAYGAARLAMGGWNCSVEEKFPFLRPWAACPECGMPGRRGSIISKHLNDLHRWTRERIADWVETIEPRDPDPAEYVPVGITAEREEWKEKGYDK